MEPDRPPRAFRDAAQLRAWFAKNGGKEAELWIKYYKVGVPRAGLRYREALDEALCFGWIDGQVRSIDAESFMQRWTPRKKGSYWSKVNVAKAEALLAAGRMTPAGLAAFQARDPAKAEKYSFEQMPRELPAAMKARFERNGRARAFWEEQPPSYRKMAVAWVTSAKREETRERRLATLVKHSASGERLPMFAPPRKAAKKTAKRARRSRTAK